MTTDRGDLAHAHQQPARRSGFEQRSIQSNGVAWIDGWNLAAVLLARPT